MATAVFVSSFNQLYLASTLFFLNSTTMYQPGFKSV